MERKSKLKWGILTILIILACQVTYAQQIKKSYVVDTIEVSTLYKVFVKKNDCFFQLYAIKEPKKSLKKINLKKIINDDNLFFTNISFYSFFDYDNPEKVYNCKLNSIKISNGKVEIHKIEDVEKLLICLVNADFYNERIQSVDYKSWNTVFNKGMYIKLAFPICKKHE
ncbi:hypothetical protein R9C00_16415 [Flammeovirgaceae bacterium SG7u.111]|nr:hypothetical protein [Flammeovirgaceae bacterium SG7u.132]WPO33287.1 hypothetical protein R9C00_16415 [Flammeovirgaceae bacterium SG7u.111]